MSEASEDRIERLYTLVGHNIREARRKAHLTQSQLADAVGLKRTSVTNLEAGRQHVPLHTLVWIADVLKVSAGSLLPTTPMFEDLIVVPDLAAHLANDDKNMRSFVESTVAKVAVASRKGA